MNRLNECRAALRVLQRAVRRLTRALEKNSPETLQALYEIAWALFRQGKTIDAERVLRDVVEEQRIILGLEHVCTLRSLHGLGTALRFSERAEEALPILESAVDGLTRLLGGEDATTRVARRELQLS